MYFLPGKVTRALGVRQRRQTTWTWTWWALVGCSLSSNHHLLRQHGRPQASWLLSTGCATNRQTEVARNAFLPSPFCTPRPGPIPARLADDENREQTGTYSRQHKVERALGIVLIFLLVLSRDMQVRIISLAAYMRLTCVAFGHRLTEPPEEIAARSVHVLTLNTNDLAFGSLTVVSIQTPRV